MKKIACLLCVLLLMKEGFCQQFKWPTDSAVLTYSMQLVKHGDEKDVTQNLEFTAHVIPMYKSAKLVIAKLENVPLFPDFDLDSLKRKHLGTCYLVVINDSLYSGFSGFDVDMMNAFKALRQRKIQEQAFIKLFDKPVISTKRDVIFYRDGVVAQKGYKVNDSTYAIEVKTNNDKATYTIESNKGVTKVDYLWGRIKTYTVTIRLK